MVRERKFFKVREIYFYQGKVREYLGNFEK